MNGTTAIHTTTTFGGLAADSIGRSDHRPALVLLHGLTFDRRMWRPALEELDRIDPERRAIAVDLPGHGESPDASSYGLEATVAQVHDAILDAGLVEPVLVGHSASAAAVAVYAAQHPTRGIVEVEGSVLVAPFAQLVKSLEPELHGDGFDAAWARVSSRVFGLDEVSDDVRAFVEATSRPRPEVVLSNWSDLLTRSTAELEALIDGAAGAVRAEGIPVAAVFGRQPAPAEMDWYGAHLPDVRTLVWPGSGHFPQLAYPIRFAELLASTAMWSRAGVPALRP